MKSIDIIVTLTAVTWLGACASSERRPYSGRHSNPPETQAPVEAEDEVEANCNIGMTLCSVPGETAKNVTVKQDDQPPWFPADQCLPGDKTCYLRIEAVGSGDPNWDAGQSLVGIVCSPGDDGLTWSNGFYRGRLEDCGNGQSYEFQYVKVQRIDAL